jgi:hypothetical protein
VAQTPACHAWAVGGYVGQNALSDPLTGHWNGTAWKWRPGIG